MFLDNPNFYPTSRKIIDLMLSDIDFRQVQSILEPSAGRGNIIERVIDKLKYSHSYSYNKEAKWDIDAIELDDNLRHVLTGKGHRVVCDDFLSYHTYKAYDLIIANPPFSAGDKHLLKMIQLMENHSGTIICLLNAETIKNPYSNIRKELINKLEQYNASIEYIQNAFVESDRHTNVEVALIKIKFIKNTNNSIILDELEQEESHNTEFTHNNNTLINGDFIKGIIEQYNFEVKAGLKLIAEYKALKPLMLTEFKSSYSILELSLHYKDQDDNCTMENSYIKQVRMKYWKALFTSEQFMGLFTSNLRQQYYNKVNELKDYDFSMYNIATIKIQLNKEMIKGVEECLLDLFEELTHKHYYHKEMGSNIHYYNGWTNNKAYKINEKKVIIPLAAFRDMQYSWGRYEPTHYSILDKLSDLEKTFNYLNNYSEINIIDLKESLKTAEHYGETKKIETTYFFLDFYKKGTAHIYFKYPELVHKLNIFGSQKKGWLPPSYSKTNYNDMSKEEQTIINEFEGRESYNKVLNNKNNYLVNINNILLLAQ